MDAGMDNAFRKFLENDRARYMRLMEQARAGQFSIDKEPNAQTVANVLAHVRAIQTMIDAFDFALRTIDEAGQN